MTARTPSRRGPLAAQSREPPEPYSLPARVTSGTPSGWYFTAGSKIGVTPPPGRWRGKPPPVPGGVPDFLLRRPDVLEVNRRAVPGLAERLGGEVEIDAAGEGVGDDERRRGEVVGPHLGVDAALEVAVARQHAGDDQAVVGHAAR